MNSKSELKKNSFFLFWKIPIFFRFRKIVGFFFEKSVRIFFWTRKNFIFCRRKNLKFLWNLRTAGNPENPNFQPNRTSLPTRIPQKPLTTSPSARFSNMYLHNYNNVDNPQKSSKRLHLFCFEENTNILYQWYLIFV